MTLFGKSKVMMVGIPVQFTMFTMVLSRHWGIGFIRHDGVKKDKTSEPVKGK